MNSQINEFYETDSGAWRPLVGQMDQSTYFWMSNGNAQNTLALTCLKHEVHWIYTILTEVSYVKIFNI